MTERKLKLIPTNPFTPRQREIIELRANGLSNGQVAETLGISITTVKTQIGNDEVVSGGSIFGKIEKATGERPRPNNWVAPLIGDVLVFREED